MIALPRWPRLVGLLGAECTGKTELARSLAERLGGLWVPEYLREFVEQNARTPRRDEQAMIMETQHTRTLAVLTEGRAVGAALVFADTTPLMTALYSLYVFGDSSLIERGLALQAGCAVTLLTAPDIPWQADGLQRDGPEARAAVDRLLRRVLSEHDVRWHEVSGHGAARIEAALAALGTLSDVLD